MILYKLFPWIKGTIMDDFIVDAVQPRLSAMKKTPKDVSEIVREIEYSDKPTFIRQLYNLTYELSDPFLVIDSWDAIELFSKSKYGEGLTEEMIEFARKTDVKIIFVTEYYEQRRLDYLTDAVINLEKKSFDGKTVRIINIEKMRGVEVSRDRYLFTLKGGIFRHLKPLKTTSFRMGRKLENKVIGDLDDLEKWMIDPKSSRVIIVEYDKQTHKNIPLCVLISIVEELGMERDTKIAISEGIGMSSIKSVRDLLTENSGKEKINDVDLIKRVKMIENSGDFKKLILVYPSGHEIIENLSAYSDMHLRFNTISGTPLFRGLKPDTPFYYLEFDEEGFNSFVKLV